MKKAFLKTIFLLCTIIMSCEKDQIIIVEQTNSNFKVYSFNIEDITGITSKIKSFNTTNAFGKSEDTESKIYWIDTENIYGAVDSIGNKSYTFRLFFNNMPKKTLYNIIVTDRVNDEIVPFVVAYNVDNGVKTLSHYYALDSFLNELISRKSSEKSFNHSYDSHNGDDDILNFTDCGELSEGGEGGSITDSTSGGGVGSGGSIDTEYSTSGNTYSYLGAYNVYSWGSGGGTDGGVTATIEVGGLIMYPPVNALRANSNKNSFSMPDDRTICPEGEVIIVINEVILPENYVVVSPIIPIANMEEYLNCFNTTQGAKITFSVDQPIANSTSMINDTFDVGHAFITIEQGGNTMSFGFYPENETSILSPVQGIMGNNSNTDYDVSLSINVNSTTLTEIINYSTIFSESNYDLISSNCTDFTISVGNIIGIDFTESSTYVMVGEISNPGVLGQVIRNMDIPSGATRTTTTGSQSPSNHKTCN